MSIPFPIRLAAVVIVACLAVQPTAWAQVASTGEPPDTVRVRIGPLYLNPSISLTNLGIDTNVFNEATDQDPKQDFTFTLEPAADLWLRMGRTWITGRIAEQVVWYQEYETQRSSNIRYQLGWRVPLNRLSFAVNGSHVDTRERPGYEIDTRAQHSQRVFDGVVEYRVLANTFFGLRGATIKVEFAEGETFQGDALAFELNRTTSEVGVTVRNQLTPLTSLHLDVSRSEDRFESSPLRNANSTAIAAGLRFDPLALLKGGASIGYRNFRALGVGVPDYTGSIMAVDLAYVLLDSTRFNVVLSRDVEFSFDVNQPYYLQTGLSGSITQQIYGPLDVVGRFSRQRLSYRDRAGATVAASDRVDQVRGYGGGVGYHLGPDLRIGVNIDQSTRESPIVNRRYEGLKFGIAVTYGL